MRYVISEQSRKNLKLNKEKSYKRTVNVIFYKKLLDYRKYFIHNANINKGRAVPLLYFLEVERVEFFQ